MNEFIVLEEEASGSGPLENQRRAETALSFEPSAIALPTLAGHGNEWCFILILLHWQCGRLTTFRNGFKTFHRLRGL